MWRGGRGHFFTNNRTQGYQNNRYITLECGGGSSFLIINRAQGNQNTRLSKHSLLNPKLWGVWAFFTISRTQGYQNNRYITLEWGGVHFLLLIEHKVNCNMSLSCTSLGTQLCLEFPYKCTLTQLRISKPS